FSFVSLDYTHPEKNLYAYRLDGVDNNWVQAGTNRFARYPNLAPGKYVFHVKASNSDQIWNDGDTQILIIINPPVWQTWWFRALVETEQQKHIAEAANRAKSVFLASMSHELRTPFNSILGFAQIMRRNDHRDSEDREHLEIIIRSGEQLLALINDVLSLSKIE